MHTRSAFRSAACPDREGFAFILFPVVGEQLEKSQRSIVPATSNRACKHREADLGRVLDRMAKNNWHPE